MTSTPAPAVRTTSLGGPQSNLLNQLSSNPVDVLVLDTSQPVADPLTNWLLQPTDRLFEMFRELVEPEKIDPVVVLFLDPATHPATHDVPVAEAAFASLQAVVQSLGSEHPRTRATVVRARSDQKVAVQDLVAFLASPAGGYVSVTTIDLRSAS